MRNVVWGLALACMLAAGCNPSAVGRACDSTAPCPSGFTCAPAHDGTTRCMRECDISGPMAETVCNDGTVCLPMGSSDLGGACYLGGNIAVGDTCSNDLDCTRTALCVHGGSGARCFIGCNLDGTHPCTNSQPCTPTLGDLAGYCGAPM